MPQTSINIRLDETLKNDAENLFNRLGLNMSTAVNVFFRQAVSEQAIPFKIKADNPFYSETNMKHLMESIKQLEEGKVIVKTLKELEDMENE